MKRKRCQSGLKAAAAAFALLVGAPLALQAQDLRTQEMAQCLPGEISTWGDGIDRPVRERKLVFAYQHQHAPAWFSRAEVLTALQAAAAGLECLRYPGRSPQQRSDRARSRPPHCGGVERHCQPGQFWSGRPGRTFAGFGGPRRSTCCTPAIPAHDASSTLQIVISHEMGHFFGIMAHSRRCVGRDLVLPQCPRGNLRHSRWWCTGSGCGVPCHTAYRLRHSALPAGQFPGAATVAPSSVASQCKSSAMRSTTQRASAASSTAPSPSKLRSIHANRAGGAAPVLNCCSAAGLAQHLRPCLRTARSAARCGRGSRSGGSCPAARTGP